MKDYMIEYINQDYEKAVIYITASTAKQALKIAKNKTKCLMRDMHIITIIER